jgi:hypothetical protein
MALSDIVSISVSTSGAPVERAGFGVPLILAPLVPAGFTERVRFYTSLTDMAAAGFATTEAAYLMAAAVFSQNPKPSKIAVGRLALAPTQQYELTPVVSNSTDYTATIDGHAVTYTSDGTATAAEITGGLKTLIDALGLAVTTSLQNTNATLRIVANAAGAFHSVSVSDVSRCKIVQNHADPGVATDLAAIALENSDWYCVLNAVNSKAMASAIAAWVESNAKLFLCQTSDSEAVTLAQSTDNNSGSPTTLAEQLHASAYFRTAAVYHPVPSAFAGAAWAGACLPLDPGSETWAYKTLAGVTASSLTATQRTNALAKNCNTYTTIAGLNATEQGKVAGNEYIDVIRFRDWLQSNMQADIFAVIKKSSKVPFTDAGISAIKAAILGRLDLGVLAGGLAGDPAPSVTVPKAADVSAADKSARSLTGVRFAATLAGAIQAVTISGTVTL